VVGGPDLGEHTHRRARPFARVREVDLVAEGAVEADARPAPSRIDLEEDEELLLTEQLAADPDLLVVRLDREIQFVCRS
jgi:hypothetical protein